MEGTAIAPVGYSNRVPALMVRALSDLAEAREGSIRRKEILSWQLITPQKSLLRSSKKLNPQSKKKETLWS